MKNIRTYTVHWESATHIGFNTCYHGKLTALKKQFKKEGKKITKIEYEVNGWVVDVKEF